jgi:phage major head subunit gpT-like protein
MLGEKGPGPLDGLIDQSETDSQIERYPVLGTGGGLAEWVDEIQASNIDDYVQLVENRPYAKSYLVDRFTLGDTKKTIGSGLESFINSQLQEWKTLGARIIAALMVANPNAFDGTAFFANDRPNIARSGAIDNIVAGTGTTDAQLTADLANAINQMNSMIQANGDPFHAMVDYVVMVPPRLELAFKRILQADLLSIGGVSVTNTFKGMFQVVKNPYINHLTPRP